NSKGPGTPLSEDDRQYTFGWTTDDVQGTDQDATGVEHAQVNTPTGWCQEMKIPWSSLSSQSHGLGDLIGIDLFINDDDDADTRETQIGTFADDGGDWQNPADWGTGILVKGSSEKAAEPSPADGAVDVPRDVALGWKAGEFANTHDVYFGTVFDDVNAASRSNPLDVLLSEGQSETTYTPDNVLEFGQTYYWRIDEVNGAPDNTIFKGEVWSFTAEPFGIPIEDIVVSTNSTNDGISVPEKMIDGSGLNANDEHSTNAPDMWLGVPAGADPVYVRFDFDKVYKLHELLVWNYNVQFELVLGFGFKDVTVEYTENGTDWTALGDVQFAQATAKADYMANTAVALNGVAASGLRLTVNSGYGPMGQFGLSEVRILAIPAQAREPQPADAESDVPVDTALSWRAGREAVTHDVYLGADADALALVDSVDAPTYTPGGLEFGSTYYWRIDEVNEADEITVWAGNLWSFVAQEFAVIDDMESYDDEENRIYDTWFDGFVNGTGSTVGYFEAPFAEQTIVNSGRQSMPLEYDNSIAPLYSEADLDVGSADWTNNGADTLRIFFAGQAPGFLETADGAIVMNAIGVDIWDTADEFRYAYKQLTGNGSMVARVEALDGAPSTWAKAGVMVRQSTAVGSTHSFMCMTGGDGNGASWQGRTADNSASVNNDATSAVAPPYWVRIDRAGDSLTGFISPDGETWTQLGDARTIAMADPVLIGLALTSHNANMATSVVFSNVSFTGNVTGDWQVAEIGVAQPEGNIPEALYVAIEDTSGNVAVVTHPDPGATAVPGWNEWLIPYCDLAGVNLSRVAIMYIGVGDRDNPTAGGTGLIFIDDIGYGHPAPETAPVNMLANGGFEDGVMDPWSIYGDATGEVVADDPAEGDACLHITVNSAGANFWDAGLQHTGHVFEAADFWIDDVRFYEE
ncbi:MAG: sugar-binding protein, partial [Planctomycetota bacterium]